MKKTVLSAVASGLLALGLTGCFNKPTLPKLGIQAYTLRSYTYDAALQKVQSLGIHYMEIYPGQKIDASGDAKIGHTLDAARRAKLLQMAKDHAVTLVSYGVITGKNNQDWEEVFGFAKDLHLISINCQATPDLLGYLDGLSKKYSVKVALHNHPGIPGIINPSNPYADPNVAFKALQGSGDNIGVCADTGHWVRTGFNPVEALHLLRGHIVELHFKDLDQGNILGKDMPWGTGISRAGLQLAELRRQGFDGVVLAEYENNSPELMENLKKCVNYFEGAMRAPIADLINASYLPSGFSKTVETQIHNPEALKSGRWPEPTPLLPGGLADAETSPAGLWKLDQGILEVSGTGTLTTKHSYENYTLSFDFLATDASRARVHLKSAPGKFPAQDIDIVIAGGAPIKDRETTGAVVIGSGSGTNPPACFGPTRPIPIKAGAWNSLVIKARDSSMKVYLNHELMNTISYKTLEKVFAPQTSPTLNGSNAATTTAMPTNAPVIANTAISNTTNEPQSSDPSSKAVPEMISGTKFTTITAMGPPRVDNKEVIAGPFSLEKGPIILINDASKLQLCQLKIDMSVIKAPVVSTETTVSNPLNSLTPEEKAAGWQLLFNGKDFAGWHNFGMNTVKSGWRVEDGCLICADPHQAGDIVTDKKYGWFELELDYNITPSGNSGVMYRVVDDGKHKRMWETGPEFQLEDNQLAVDPTRCGWLYALYQPPLDPATGKTLDATKPVGQWNHIRLVVSPAKCEHLINGVKYFEYTLNSDDFKRRVAASKFGKMPGFAEASEGFIGLQGDHGAISFKNIKIRPITP
jgi:sugar phosphate isomerase/epimerase